MRPQSKQKQDKILRVRVTGKHIKSLDKEAKRLGINRSELVRLICVKYFGEI